MKTIAALAVLAQVCSWVEASNCRASRCNAAIAKAVNCNTNRPGQCASAIGCGLFYSTTVYRGCATTTITVSLPQQTVTQAEQITVTTTQDQPTVDQTIFNTDTTTDTVLTETSYATAVIATETETIVSIVATETSTITEIIATRTIEQTQTATVSIVFATIIGVAPQVGPAFPGNRKRTAEPVPTKHIFSPAELAELNEQTEEHRVEKQGVEGRSLDSRAIRYPKNVPGAAKTCLNPRSYSAACGCFGASPRTITKATSTKTIKVEKTMPASTIRTTDTVTTTATNPQVTQLVTITTILIQLATETTTETSSITSMVLQVDETTAEELTTLFTVTATTSLTTATVTNTEVVTVTAVTNPFRAGGSCGCRQRYVPGQRFDEPGSSSRYTVQSSFADCARDCDERVFCKYIDYNVLTGLCRQRNQPGALVNDADFYYGEMLFEASCGTSCAS